MPKYTVMNQLCPECKKNKASREQGVAPFCSKRCKMLDLEAWTSGTYCIPGRPADPDELLEALAERSDKSEFK